MALFLFLSLERSMVSLLQLTEYVDDTCVRVWGSSSRIQGEIRNMHAVAESSDDRTV